MGVGPESCREQSSVDGVIEIQDLVTGRRVPLGDHLANIGASPELTSALLRPDGSFGYRATLPDLHNVNPDDLQQQMLAAIGPVHEGINAIFNEATLGGRSPNDHGPRHIRTVVGTARRLAEEAGYQSCDVRKVIIGAATHDVGNLVNREDHALVGVELILKIFPQLKWYPDVADDVLKAVALHDGDMLRKEFGITTQTSHAELIEKYQQLGKVFAPLVIADKADIGPGRLSDRAVTREELNDIHVGTNWRGVSKYVGLGEDEGTFMWWVAFNKEIPEAEAQRHPDLVQREPDGKYTGVSSRKMEWMQRETGESEFALWTQDLRRIRKHSISLVADAAFAMHPQVDRFALVLSDENGEASKREQPHVSIFRRAHIDGDMDAYWERHGLMNLEHDGSYHPLKITT